MKSHAPLDRKGEAMKRLPGITVSAIVLILGSLLQFLFALGAASAGLIEHSQMGSGGAMAGKAGVPIRRGCQHSCTGPRCCLRR